MTFVSVWRPGGGAAFLCRRYSLPEAREPLYEPPSSWSLACDQAASPSICTGRRSHKEAEATPLGAGGSDPTGAAVLTPGHLLRRPPDGRLGRSSELPHTH